MTSGSGANRVRLCCHAKLSIQILLYKELRSRVVETWSQGQYNKLFLSAGSDPRNPTDETFEQNYKKKKKHQSGGAELRPQVVSKRHMLDDILQTMGGTFTAACNCTSRYDRQSSSTCRYVLNGAISGQMSSFCVYAEAETEWYSGNLADLGPKA